MIAWTIFATAMTAVLYRLGGLGKDGHKRYPWIPKALCHSYVRDAGITAVCFAWMLRFYPSVGAMTHIISAIAMYAFLTTYWDRVFGEDNFYAHGFGVGVAYLLYAVDTGLWLQFIARVIVMSLFMGAWCRWLTNDNAEELGRGLVIGATLPLLLAFA